MQEVRRRVIRMQARQWPTCSLLVSTFSLLKDPCPYPYLCCKYWLSCAYEEQTGWLDHLASPGNLGDPALDISLGLSIVLGLACRPQLGPLSSLAGRAHVWLVFKLKGSISSADRYFACFIYAGRNLVRLTVKMRVLRDRGW